MLKKNEPVDFFDMFIKSAEYACMASEKLLDLVRNYNNIDSKVAEVKKIEKDADENAHKVYRDLAKAFITPIEREDILAINQSLDNVVDKIEEISKLFFMLNITNIRSDVIPFVELIVKSCITLKDAIQEFKNFKKSKILIDKIIEVNTIEEEGDAVYSEVVRKLFAFEPKELEIIKWYQIYSDIEDCLDDCESVTNIMEDVILKNS